MSKSLHIALIDSGVGGLTVFQHVAAKMPEAHFTYICDGAFFPYGGLTSEALSQRVTNLLTQLQVEYPWHLGVVACNTASTIVLPTLRQTFSQAIVGVVPAVKPAAQLTRNGKIVVLATAGTVQRDYLRGLVDQFGGDHAVHLVAAPSLVDFAEKKRRGQSYDHEEFTAFMKSTVLPIGADTIVLGCTHFPILRQEIELALGPHVTVLDSGEAIGNRVRQVVDEQKLGLQPGRSRDNTFFSTGPKIEPALRQHLEEIGFRILVADWG